MLLAALEDRAAFGLEMLGKGVERMLLLLFCQGGEGAHAGRGSVVWISRLTYEASSPSCTSPRVTGFFQTLHVLSSLIPSSYTRTWKNCAFCSRTVAIPYQEKALRSHSHSNISHLGQLALCYWLI